MAEEKPAEKGGGKNIFALVFLVVNLAVMGGGAFMVYMATMGHQTPTMEEELEIASLIAERESRAVEPVVYAMNEFNVNLSGLPRRKLRVAMHLEMLDEEGFEELVTLGAESRDAIVHVLSDKVFADVESIQGKLFLKDQIASTLNRFLQKGVVKDVYFSTFLVQ